MQREHTEPLPYQVARGPAGPAHASATSWPAIFAGAAAAAALSLILVLLGMGLGLSSISPWSSEGASATTIGISTAIWLALTQIIASGMGGYLSGRLRVRWADADRDEVYFRDTAHGMLSWAVATLVTAAFLGSAIGGLVSGGAKAVGSVASGTMTAVATGGSAAMAGGQEGGGAGGGQLDYFVDSLFRSDTPAGDATGNQGRNEALTILVKSVGSGELTPEDKTYLAGLVAQRTNLSAQEAEARVDEIYANAVQTLESAETTAREAADTARKAAAGTALWTFVALLCGAFFASLFAVWGGRRRDAIDG